MQLFKEYGDYLNDNPEGYWFKRKLYGWGWVPARWQGWAVLLVFVGVMVLLARSTIRKPQPTTNDVLWYVASFLASVAALIIICYRTGEPPKCRWGRPKR